MRALYFVLLLAIFTATSTGLDTAENSVLVKHRQSDNEIAGRDQQRYLRTETKAGAGKKLEILDITALVKKDGTAPTEERGLGKLGGLAKGKLNLKAILLGGALAAVVVVPVGIGLGIALK
uniref:Avh201 n=1 Tax=Phytophthora sojae TaxID=67593 RepID=G1FS12_PHYSO|nr:Avh201 [Phytophthora sojae]